MQLSSFSLLSHIETSKSQRKTSRQKSPGFCMVKFVNRQLRKLIMRINRFDTICFGNLDKSMPVKRKYEKNGFFALLSRLESLRRTYAN